MLHRSPLILTLAIICLATGTAPATAKVAISAGSDPLEQTAAADLAMELDGETNDARIVIGTVGTNDAIAAAHAQRPFDLDPAEPEGFHLQRRGDTLFVVGASPKGAMNGAFRLLDLGAVNDPALDVVGRPNFRYRVAGHKINQSPPPDWSEEDQARFYARHYINVVWGEKKAPPMSYEARKKYGLGLMQELRIPSSATAEWWSDPANAQAIYRHKPGSDRRVISPFTEAGRRWYLDGYRRLLRENPDTKILYAIFGDYNAIPSEQSVRLSDGKPHGHSREETMLEILSIMREAIDAELPDAGIVPRAWLWHAFYGDRAGEVAFMQELTERGFGLMYNEAGNNDDWVFKLDNFDDMALEQNAEGELAWGDEYLSLVSAGGACESVNPVIGMPLPRVAAYKLGKLAEAGVRDFALWWGSGEGWTYQPNLRVLAEMVWIDRPERFADEDFAAAEPLLRTIAERDFGPELASDVVDYWRAFDAALVTNRPLYRKPTQDVQGDPTTEGLRIYDWYQRMGTYTEPVFGGAFPEPLTPQTLSNKQRFRALYGWGAQPYTVANYDAVLANLAAAQEKLRALVAEASTSARRDKLASMLQWSDLYRHLLTSQRDHLNGLLAVKRLGDEPLDSPKMRATVEPLAREAIAHTEALIEHVETFPTNFNLTQPHEGVVQNQGRREKAIEQLRGKITGMRIWLEGMTNLAKGKPVVASSQDTSKDRKPAYATDGDVATLWASAFGDDEWIYVDLEEPHRLAFASLVWKTAYAKSFEVQVATGDEPRDWRTVFSTDEGRDGAMRIDFPEGTVARYVRVVGIERGSPYGYALREIELYGSGIE